ncbi:hypothetical protein SAMN04487988_1241, partial [Algoriphagus hitonicola]
LLSQVFTIFFALHHFKELEGGLFRQLWTADPLHRVASCIFSVFSARLSGPVRPVPSEQECKGKRSFFLRKTIGIFFFFRSPHHKRHNSPKTTPDSSTFLSPVKHRLCRLGVQISGYYLTLQYSYKKYSLFSPNLLKTNRKKLRKKMA